ncbi:uncharacterized protein RHIMIDRAFT_254222 [Rhizopus microsporus ATCC 52813]|uniref:Uncharacterized protein n=1 Tax=Rhizopus microsporus ATCC 52813 TaxID=1340429 RepID=A0A2G4T955_RHIZD|nr:uncharacterized protein RHIMIDRAFT_254222 [Rhizopus microsporus ATCC 52813]PHZ17542.1 hypothetical protein RHIMIDRAFT_254222 [Rhizopus microsporus ATCC 52813]
MEGTHIRRREKAHLENEVEYLDEVEQETLIEDLRNQNDKANLNILKGLLVISCFVCLMYIGVLLFQSDGPIKLPGTGTFGSTGILRMSATSSILSIVIAFLTLLVKCNINLFGIIDLLSINLNHTLSMGVASCILGAIGPYMCLLYKGSRIETIFWCLPLFILFIYHIVYATMKQVQNELKELERTKYKYKGA